MAPTTPLARAAESDPSAALDDGRPTSRLDIDVRDNAKLKALYLDAEGPTTDTCSERDVFGEGITIEDNLALVVDYSEGATLSYSLNAHSPWEGYRVAMNGTEGRVELDVVERGAVIPNVPSPGRVDPTAAKSNCRGWLRSAGGRTTPHPTALGGSGRCLLAAIRRIARRWR